MKNRQASLMINFDTPDIISKIQKSIPEEELYTDGSADYGIENETHVTVVPCLKNDTDLGLLKTYLKDISRYKTILTNISVFKNEDYDVLKCDAQSVVLKDTNSKIVKDFETQSEYPNYHPHVTIAYLKSGMADKYTKEYLMPLVILEPKEFHYSYYDKEGNHKDIKFVN